MSNYNWNRSSSWSPAVIALLNTAVVQAVERAISTFDNATVNAALTDDEKAEAVKLISQGCTNGIAEFEKTLRPKQFEVEAAFKS
jgi:hypothetical protein